ncbi:MAG: porin family protein [Betaproteobacteria bacterium]|nr:porin family protein [Betaproteobacteria bacterium]
MKKWFFVFAIASTFTAPTFAEGFYIGLDAGRARVSGDEDVPALKTTAVGIYGGYQFTKYLATEVSYRDLGKKDVELFNDGSLSISGNVKANTTGASVVATLPIDEAFGLFARLGYARTNAKINVPDFGITVKDHINGALYGAGAHYVINKQFDVRAEYTRLNKADTNLFLVGVAYHF